MSISYRVAPLTHNHPDEARCADKRARDFALWPCTTRGFKETIHTVLSSPLGNLKWPQMGEFEVTIGGLAIQMPIDNRAVTNWKRAQHAYEHYQRFIALKPDRYALGFADLAFVKNFKGGSALIAEPVATFATKLSHYEKALRACAADGAFSLTLSNISAADYYRVREAIVAFAALPEALGSRISGFRSSFASALLHFHFPLVVPILDKRALNGSMIPGIQVDGDNNVTNLLPLYPALIDACRTRLQQNQPPTLRELDRQLFIERLRSPPFTSHGA